jgi:hypothetical protein
MPNIAPVSAVTPPVTSAPADAATRFYGSTDAPISVTLDAGGYRGSFTADVPLDSFTPPLSRDALSGLSMLVQMPPNTDPPSPATVVDKNGKAYLRVNVADAEVAGLRNAPMSFALGDAKSLGNISAPKFMAQVSTQKMLVDRTAPMLAMELSSRPQQVNNLGRLQDERASLSNGTSSWFGTRQLQTEHDQLSQVAQAANAAVAGPRADLESKLTAGADFDAVFSLPPALSANRDAMLANLETASNAKAQVAQLQSQRDIEKAAGIPLTQDYDTQIAALQPQTAAADGVHQQVLDLYKQARSEQPFEADLWLRSYANMKALPNANQFTDQIWSAHNAQDQLAQNEAELARLTAQDTKALPVREQQLDAQIAGAKTALAATDARISAMRAGTDQRSDLFSASYSPDMKII